MVRIATEDEFVPSPDSKTTKRYRLTKDEAAIIDSLRSNGRPHGGNILVIGDTHEPWCLEGYLDFCLDAQRYYSCETVIHIGDIIDCHALGQWDVDPDGFGPGHETHYAVGRLQRWYRAFPRVKVCLGNHDRRVDRKAFTAGIPRRFLKSLHQSLEMPDGWQVDETWEIDGVLYRHQGGGGKSPAMNYAMANGISTVMGHHHTCRGMQDAEQWDRYIFGVDTGCGVDAEAYSMAYAKNNRQPFKLGCAVVMDGGRAAMSLRMDGAYL